MPRNDAIGDLGRLTALLRQLSDEIDALAPTLTPEEAEIYCLELEVASRPFGEALQRAELRLRKKLKERPPRPRPN